MRLLTLHRAILKEIGATFLLSAIGFTVVFILALVFRYLKDGVPLAFVSEFMPCLLPHVLVSTLPMGCLFAATLAYSRLSADQEVQAAQWSGIRLATCASPAVLLGAVASLACVVLNDAILPRANARLRRVQEDAARQIPLLLACTTEPTWSTPTQKMYIHGYGEGVFRGVTVMETVNSVTTRILNAREARVSYDRERKSMAFELRDGSVSIFDPGPPPQCTDEATFARYPLNVAFDAEIEVWKDWEAATRTEIRTALRKRVEEGTSEAEKPVYEQGMTTLWMGGYHGDLAYDVAVLEARPDGTHHLLRAHEAAVAIRVDEGILSLALGRGVDRRLESRIPPWKPLEEAPFVRRDVSMPLDPAGLGLDQGLKPTTEQIRALLAERVRASQEFWFLARVELQERMATALAPLCFIAIGVPLGIWLRHGNRLISFGASLLVVFCLYIPTLAAGQALSLRGLVPAAVGMWMPDVVMAAAGLLFGRMIRY